MKKQFTDEQYDVADKLVKSANNKEYATSSMMKGFFKVRKVSNPEAEKVVEDETNYIVSTLENLDNKEKFEVLDCVAQLGRYYSKLGVLENFDNKKPLNAFTFLSRASVAVYETYYNYKLDTLLNELKGVENYYLATEQLSSINKKFNDLDERDQKYIMGRLSSHISKADESLKNPKDYDEFKQASQNLRLFDAFKYATKPKQEHNVPTESELEM